jgi:hypothetical protein
MAHAGYVDRGAGLAGAFSRVSWGAVFAGLVIATALQVVLTVLGAAVGLTALDGPDSGRRSGSAPGSGRCSFRSSRCSSAG